MVERRVYGNKNKNYWKIDGANYFFRRIGRVVG